MAHWHPADGSHGAMAGAPDAYCYTCGQFCGGLDAAGNVLVCSHCAALGLPPAEDPQVPDGSVVTVATPQGDVVQTGSAQAPGVPLLWGGQDVPPV